MPGPDPYDRLPYTDHAYAESHPDRLAVVATLSGWRPPAVAGARILELGCGRGGNLLPMAAALPGATLVGIDLSGVQVQQAREVARQAGLTHVRFEQGDVASLQPDGHFDFVVCHGLCSWVPPQTRRALFATIAHALGPGGVAYVSFNVLPGWYERLAARDWLRAFPEHDPRASLAWLREQISPELADYRRSIDAVARRLGETEHAYVMHEYLSEDHHPQRVREMLAEAAHAGLVYLGDALPGAGALELLPPAAADRARQLDPADAQQLVDFVRCTAFRRTLLVRQTDAAERDWRWPPRLDPSALSTLRVASRARPHGPDRPGAASEQFDGAQGSVQIAMPSVRRALRELGRVAPASIPYPELLARAAPAQTEELEAELLDLWLATDTVDLHAFEPVMGDGTSARPEAASLARGQADRGGTLTNLRLQEVHLAEPVVRRVLSLLDGTRTPAEIAEALRGAPEAAALDAEERASIARASIEALAACALLVR